MYLIELFGGMDIADSLQQAAMDIITPLHASNVPFVTIQSVIDSLRQLHPGILVNRALVMKILDPTKIQGISKIQGDRIYLVSPDETSQEDSEDQAQKDIDQVKKNAIKQSQKSLQSDAPKPSPQKELPTGTN